MRVDTNPSLGVRIPSMGRISPSLGVLLTELGKANSSLHTGQVLAHALTYAVRKQTLLSGGRGRGRGMGRSPSRV
jgi:hypothetical protein